MFAKSRKFVNINDFSFCEAACFQLLNVGAVIAFTGVCVRDVTVIGILERMDAEAHEGSKCVLGWIKEEQR